MLMSNKTQRYIFERVGGECGALRAYSTLIYTSNQTLKHSNINEALYLIARYLYRLGFIKASSV